MWPGFGSQKYICIFDTRLTMFETQSHSPFFTTSMDPHSMHSRKDDSTHLMYNASRKPMEVDDGDVEDLRAETRGGGG